MQGTTKTQKQVVIASWSTESQFPYDKCDKLENIQKSNNSVTHQ